MGYLKLGFGMHRSLESSQVLDDCMLALELLESETDPQRFRLFWLAAVAALRSVGHVLHKVDAARSQKHERAVSAAYSRWKEDREAHRIFWLFIDYERNSVLKEADPSVYPIAHKLSVDPDLVYELDFDIFAPMLKGPWEGEDCRDVVSQAIEWWRVELSRIQAEAVGQIDA